ncbi:MULTISPECIES: hypothetical protein [Streptomyces]|uniref:Lipoprotein n=1 Tax=Streptomyces canarius TaxID=285453 RepID=A0ABQ3DF20_9ACTN|nr:hypothetical protein [Streptomyces canarius]GHA68824.1 hypothetical protein GCM10010345_85580 [Streptomyces canarius]
MRTCATITLAAAALLALSACSSSSHTDEIRGTHTAQATSPSAQPRTTPSAAGATELQQAVQAYTEAYFKGDATTAYAALSKRCKSKMPSEAYEQIVKRAAADYGTGHPATDMQAQVSGTLARVSYKVRGLPKFDQQAQPWTREGGTWKYDAC